MADMAARGNATEVRVTSSTGGAKGTKQAAFADMPAAALYEIAEHTGKGVAKYPNLDGIPNFRHGYEWSLSYAALMRHMVQFWAGEDMDEESGSKPVIAAAWHAINLATLMDEHRELDDRVTTVRARNAEAGL